MIILEPAAVYAARIAKPPPRPVAAPPRLDSLDVQILSCVRQVL